MSVIIPVNYGLLSFHTTTEGDQEEMVWTVGVHPNTTGDFVNVLDDAVQFWGANIQPLTSSVVTLQRATIKEGPNSTGNTIEFPVGVAGTDGGSLLPPNCAVLVQKLTGTGGRSHRGRAYLPGISSISAGLDSAGNIDATRTNAVTSAMTDFMTDLAVGDVSDGAELVLFHSASSDVDVITSLVCSPKIATQRRRLRP